MGRLVTFQARASAVEARTESILARLRQHEHSRQRAEAELPAVLAELVRAGHPDLVLKAVSLWGSGQSDPQEVLSLVELWAAVAGVATIGNRPLHR